MPSYVSGFSLEELLLDWMAGMLTHYDVALANTQEYFTSRIREFCSQFDLSFFLVEPIWVADFLKKLREGAIRVHVLIDVASDAYAPDDLYFAVAQEVKKAGGRVIDDPDRAAVTAHKGRFHRMLLENGVPVPETVIVPRAELEGFRLTEEVKSRVGVPFVVKPGWGGGRQGVILDGRSEEELHRSARETPDSDSFLIQRKLTPATLDGHVAWFRVFHIFGEVIPCWWEPPANQYQLVTPLQQRLYRLAPLKKLVRQIARISNMEFFSTEIALTADSGFLVVDYLNTNCDMHAKSFWPTGVPDEVVRHIAWSLVEHALTIAHRRKGPFDEELEEKDLDWEERRKKGRLVPGE